MQRCCSRCAPPRAGGGDTASARAWVGELIGDDYRRLDRTVRLPAAQARWGVDWQAAPALLSLTAENELLRTALGPPTDAGVVSATARLSALRPAVVVRELRVEGEGSAGEFELNVAIAHPASGEVALTLAAPSGAQATMLLPQSNAASSESYVFAAQEGTPLAALADEERRGLWRLTIVDRRVENTGTLGGWGLRFGEEGWRDDPPDGVALPDPTRTEAVTVEMSADDAFAIVQPAERGPIGSVALWNLATGLLEHDFTLPQPPQYVAINASSTRLLAGTASLVTLWNVADAMPIARVATQTEFVLPPTFSSDGGYVAIAERVGGSAAAIQPAASTGRFAAGEHRRPRSGGALVARPWCTLFRVARAEQRAAARRRPQRQGAAARAARARCRARAAPAGRRIAHHDRRRR